MRPLIVQSNSPNLIKHCIYLYWHNACCIDVRLRSPHRAAWRSEMKNDTRPEQLKEYQRFRRRYQSGVEIVERETVSTITVDDGEFKMNQPPQLVISEAAASSKRFITRTRSQLGEVDALLRSVLRRPINAK